MTRRMKPSTAETAAESLLEQSSLEGERKRKELPLHGWDDEKIYYWDEARKHEWCVSDDEVLYRQLLEICRRHFRGSDGRDK